MDDDENRSEVSEEEVDEAIERIDDPKAKEWFLNHPEGQVQGRGILRLFLAMSEEDRLDVLRSMHRTKDLPREMREQMSKADLQLYLNSDAGDVLN